MVVFGCVAGLAISDTACAAVSQTCADPEIWVFSTRHLPGICKVPTVVNPSVQRYEPTSCRWLSDDLGTLLGGKGPLIIFLHGNRYDPYSAKKQGIQLSRRCNALASQSVDTQFMIYSWPSQQDGCLLKDGRSKYRRCFTEGHYLAWLLGQISPERPVVFIGYSFGALITLEALEDLVAAENAGYPVSPWQHRPGDTRLIFVAPAVRCDAFSPRGKYRKTLACVDRVSLTINSRDDALRFFHLLDTRTKVDALGCTGMPRRWMPSEIRYSAIDARNIIGREHGLTLYLRSNMLMQRICGEAYGGLENLSHETVLKKNQEHQDVK
ncbi:MAG: alpha/beta hydrolase [Planctomycetaceae bacterium]|nr:alpha/beta hydrolase [Planctomycetaceae bacterium]